MNRLALTGLIICLSTLSSLAGPEPIQSSGKEMKTTVAPVAEEFSWSGFYVGLHLGYGWHDGEIDALLLPSDTFSIEPGTHSNDSDGIVGGGQIGYNFQVNRFVFGIEADFSGADISGGSHPNPTIAPIDMSISEPLHHDIDWFGTARGRFGFTPVPKLLLYGTGGFAYAHIEQFAGIISPIASYVNTESGTETGWTAGGGIEYALNRRWSVKVEYLYFDVGDQSMTAQATPPNPVFTVDYDWDNTFHTVTAGVNFRF